MPQTWNWSVQGDYFETCNCETACPCVRLQPPTEGDCKPVWAVAGRGSRLPSGS